jgi:hypothetical protein
LGFARFENSPVNFQPDYFNPAGTQKFSFTGVIAFVFIAFKLGF